MKTKQKRTQVTPIDRSEHYKMYKAGKTWLFQAVIVGLVLTGPASGVANVFAATTNAQEAAASAASAQSQQSGSQASAVTAASAQQADTTKTTDASAQQKATVETSSSKASASSVAQKTVTAKAAEASSSVVAAPATKTVTAQDTVSGLTDNIKSSLTVSAKDLANANGVGPFTAGVNQVIPYEAFGGDGMLTRLLLNGSDKAPWSDNGTAKNAALLPVDGLASGKYFYEVDLGGNAAGKTGQALLDQLRADGSQSYSATVKIYAAGADGKADTSKVVATKSANIAIAGLTDNIQSSITVSAKDLANANGVGPFTAGVNQVIPYEAFGGDGMLTRLLLNGADKAPWSDNGTAKNAALLPVDGLASDKYFYEVDLGGNAAGKTGQALLDQLRADGSQSYSATVKIYAAGADGKADTSKVVATKSANIAIAGLTDNIQSSITVSAKDLANANGVGPFTAGVNQVIPYEAFGGDGMLTRLLLNGSDKAPWSDNGVDKNAALLPVDGLASGKYFYEVDLGGKAAGKTGQALLDQLRADGSQSYSATVKIYAAGADGEADTSKVVATKSATIAIAGLTDNIQSSITVSAKDLANANGVGPFTAGVNQVIPYEAFGGDGMLTRLLLNGSDKAPWSDNGVDKNAALLPVDGLASGKYFYEVDLGGKAAGKTGQALLDQLRADGSQSYSATVKIYAASADGKADTSKVVAKKTGLTINFTVDQAQGKPGTGATTKPGSTNGSHNAAAMGSHMTSKAPSAAKGHMATKTMAAKKQAGKSLPSTGDQVNQLLAGIGLAIIAGLAAVAAKFKFGVNRTH